MTNRRKEMKIYTQEAGERTDSQHSSFFNGKDNMAQAQAIPVAKPIAFNRYMALIYLTMALGLAITAAVSQAVYANEQLMYRIMFNSWFAFGLFLLQIFLVVGISAAVMRLSPGVAFPPVPALFSSDGGGPFLHLHLLQPKYDLLYLLDGGRHVPLLCRGRAVH